jgi:hypothetical protein
VPHGILILEGVFHMPKFTMPKFTRMLVPPTCAALVLPVVLPEKSQSHAVTFNQVRVDQLPIEPYDQPHNHNSENEPVEPSVLAFSMYTNTSAAAVLTDWQPVVWSIQSSKSTFDSDRFVSERLKAAGITLIVQRPPDDPGGDRKA